MSTKLKTGLSSYSVAIDKGKKLPFSTGQNYQVGKVYGVVTTENTPTPETFKEAGGYGGIGTIFYRNYDVSKDTPEEITNISALSKAIPLFPQSQYIPLIGELIYLVDLPSPSSQIDNTAGQKYYITFNLWNNSQQNSQPAFNEASLGSTFVENPNIRPLIPYQGDYILSGRQGNALRFSTTTKVKNNPNEWSDIGNEIDPITILTNGLAYNPEQGYYIEQINKDYSSIYLTSQQKIPLQTDKTGSINPLTNPIIPSKYTSPQVILNSDRVTINSKKDEVMLFAKTNVEISTNNIINLNAGERVHLNTNAVFLGTDNNQLPSQPVLLGYETLKIFQALQESLTQLALTLSSVIGAPQGAPIVGLNAAGKELLDDMKKLCDLIDKAPSQKVFTS